MNKDNLAAIRHLYHVAEAKTLDLKAFVACFVEDGVFVDMASGITFRGPNELWKPTAVMATAFPDMHRELHRFHVTDDAVIVELSLQGTHDGPFELPSGTIAATGKTMNAPCCDVFVLRDGKVTLFNCYNQASVILAQLGVVARAAS